MVISGLVGLCESMMVSDSVSVISETTKVRLWSLLLLDGHAHDFNLIVSKSNLNFELVWHNKFIRFNRVIVVLLLTILDLVAILLHHLLLLHL